jgi:AraC-like DNA-binding protein
MNSLLLICAFQALFLAVLVFFKKKKVQSDKILAAWLFIISVHIFVEFLQFYNYQNNFPAPWFIGIDVTFSMLHSTLIFIYILSFTRINQNPRKYIWHFLPFLIINLILFKVYYTQSPEEKIADFKSVMSGNGLLNQNLKLMTYVIMAVVVGYLVASLIYIRRHQRNLRDQLSTVKGVELQWLKLLLYTLGGVLILAIVIEILSNTLMLVQPDTGTILIFILIAIGVFYIGVHGILQTDYLAGYNPRLTDPGSSQGMINRKDIQSAKAGVQKDEILDVKYEKLITYMETEKPFLETNLNLQSLAKSVDMKPHFLSMLINQKSGRNFFDFINTFRINEFKEQVLDPSNQSYTLLSIAYSCGFNSKTAFNRAFKNIAGKTPSEYYHLARQQQNL